MDGIYNDLHNIGYDTIEKSTLSEALNDGLPNVHFMNIIAWLGSQLVSLCDLENRISPINNEGAVESSKAFLVEISSFLKELSCPIKKLITGSLECRLNSHVNKTSAITYLCSELQAAKILAQKKPKKKENTLEIELSESKTAKELREMLISLKFGKPPDNITPLMLFCELEKKLKMLSQSACPKDIVGELLFTGTLYEKQWFQLEQLFQEMSSEYKNRRTMLLTRLDVTIRSFLWSDRLKSKSEEVINTYNKQKSALCETPLVKISDILAAKAKLSSIEKTSNSTVRKNTKSAINSLIIGNVPDRGGRPEEQQPPPPEIPSWQKNDSSSRGGRGQFNHSSNYKNSNSSGPYRNQKDENQDNRLSYSNYQKGGFTSGPVSYGGRNDYIYQAPPPQYCPQLGNPQCGFGGYMPAGDNFQQFGMNEGYQHRPNTGSGPRPRGGGYNRGGRSFRGSNRGR